MPSPDKVPPTFLLIFKSWKQFAAMSYLLLIGLGIVSMYFKVLGMLPALMLLAAIGGLSHLALQWALDDDDDYQKQMDQDRGIKRKTITYFIDN